MEATSILGSARGAGGKPLRDDLGRVESPVVADQEGFLAHIRFQQDYQKRQKRYATLGLGHGVRQVARFIVRSSVDHSFLIRSGGRHFGVVGNESPHPR